MATTDSIYIDLERLKDGRSTDEVFNILSNSRRRYTLYCLFQAGGELTLGTLAKQLAAYEYDIDQSQVSDGQQRNMYISLYQTHLPKLSDHDMVQYDEDERRVRLTEQVRSAVVRFNPNGRPWHLYYASVAVLGAMGMLDRWFQLFLGELLTWSGLALLTLLGLLSIAIAQYLVTTGTLVRTQDDYFRLDELV